MEYGDQPDICLSYFNIEETTKTLTRLAGHGIGTRDLPNASLVRYQGATSLGKCPFSLSWYQVFSDLVHTGEADKLV